MTDDALPEEGELLMGRWDCGACGLRGILGDAYDCGDCGSPRPDDVQFYLPENAEVITGTAAVQAALAGPDWQCAFCEAWAPATDDQCADCGASFADSERRQRELEYAQGQEPRGVEGRAEPSAAPRVVSPRPRPSWRAFAATFGVIALFVLVLGEIQQRREAAHRRKVDRQRLVVADARAEVVRIRQEVDVAERAHLRARAAFSQAQQLYVRTRGAAAAVGSKLRAYQHAARPVTVVGRRWKVDLAIEQCRATDGEGWAHPADAFDVRSEQREHHRVRVLDRVDTLYRTETYRARDGYKTERYTERVRAGTRRVRSGYTTKSLGNGRFKRVPTYRTETVYKTVTKTRQVPRYATRTRRVPYTRNVYRQDPVYRTWYRYRTKVWGPAAPMSRSGTDLSPLDPEGRPPAEPRFELKALRVARRTVSRWLTVRLPGPGGGTRELPTREDRWRAFQDGARGLLIGEAILTAAEQQAGVTRLKRRLAEIQGALAPLSERLPALRQAVPPLADRLTELRARLAPASEKLSREAEGLRQLVAQRP